MAKYLDGIEDSNIEIIGHITAFLFIGSWEDLARENMPKDEAERFYTEEEPHRMFIGEVVEIRKP